MYSEQLATEIELLCQNIKAPSNTLFQIRKSSSSIHANIREANYGQSKADMLDLFDQTDLFEERVVASLDFCEDFVYQSDNYYTYNDYFYQLSRKMADK